MQSRLFYVLGVFFVIAGIFAAGFEEPVQLSDPIPQPSPTSLASPLPVPQEAPSTPEPLTVITQGLQTRILMYHYIRTVDQKKDRLGYGLSVTPEAFEAQLALFQREGYTSLTMDQVTQGYGGPKTIAITFDDGYLDFYTTAYPLLKKYGFTATAYIISGKIGGNYMTWDQIREVQAGGIEIGAHTVNHVDLATATEEVQRHEIFDSKAAIEEQVHVPVVSFCYPSGKHSAVTEQLVQEAGFTSATTTVEGQVRAEDNRFLLSRVRMSPGLDGGDLLHEIQP
jgi:peptidoglycan/xylan/chitin deacetylase (PgdA/CDA1 family)